jgi:glycyl-tRNA synthetase beta chain
MSANASTATLLVELCTEELPPKALGRLSEAFGSSVANYLRNDGLLTSASVVSLYATPRRLAVSIGNVLSEGPEHEVIRRLMPKTQAEDASRKPTPALLGRLKKLERLHLAEGYPDAWDGPDHLYSQSDGKVDCVWLRSLAKGSSLMPSLQSALEAAINALPIPKVMNYAHAGGYYNDVKFVRPAHGLLALHGAAIVPVSVLGLDAGRATAGHRYLGRTDLEIATAEAYAPTLEAEGKVLPSFAERRHRIVAGLEAAAGDANLLMPDALLDEVTALVEWPKVYTGGFDPAFLEVPPECLILTMQQNQKYFALAGADGRLQNRFLLVSNLDVRDPEAIIRGNERVLRARLADAKFFYDQDRKTRLADRIGRLANIIYHNRLGSLYERVVRIRGIAEDLATRLGADVAHVGRAALLCKADLVTDMVGEFPELQGVMGRYYARLDGEPQDVADAIEQHYWPRFAGDRLPEGRVAQVVALADKFEALTSLFGIGQFPTGDKDPFGLRRAAVGVLRILIEKQLHLSLADCVKVAIAWHESKLPGEEWAREIKAQLDAARTAGAGEKGVSVTGIAYVTRRMPDEATAQLFDFLYDRLRGYLRERGFDANEVAAVVDSRPEFLDDVIERLLALRAFVAMPEAEALASANKRVVNILKKSGTDAASAVDRSLFADGAEHDLFAAVQELLPVVHRHVDRGEYTEALRALASARTSVDRFFDDVLVMAEDPALRANRLALLRDLAEAMNQVADISKLAV